MVVAVEAKVDLDPSQMSPDAVYKLLSGSVVPRPIGFISTTSAGGIANLAPFSYFNAISDSPPLVCFAPDRRDAARPKDTLRNIVETREFVFNVVDEAPAAAQSHCSEDFPAEVDEFEIAGLTPVPSRFVKPPRVAESPVNMECKLFQTVPLPESTYTLVIGRVVCFAPDRRDAARPKDTLRNIVETGEFVFNVVDEALAAAQSHCSEDFPAEVDEFEIAGLTPVPSRFVKPPRVAESPVNMECKLFQTVPLPESTYTLVIGRVVCFHVRRDVYLPSGRIDFGRLKAVGRMAGGTYSRTRELFRLEH